MLLPICYLCESLTGGIRPSRGRLGSHCFLAGVSSEKISSKVMTLLKTRLLVDPECLREARGYLGCLVTGGSAPCAPPLKATGLCESQSNLGNSGTAEGLENFSPGLDQLCGPFLSVTSFSNLNIPDTAEGLDKFSRP